MYICSSSGYFFGFFLTFASLSLSFSASLTLPCPGAVVIAFVVCWLPYHARRLMFCYVSDWSEWVTILRCLPCRETSGTLCSHLFFAQTCVHAHIHKYWLKPWDYLRAPDKDEQDGSFWLDCLYLIISLHHSLLLLYFFISDYCSDLYIASLIKLNRHL